MPGTENRGGSALYAHLSARKAEAEKAIFVMSHMAAMPERKISKIFREIILPRVGISQPYAERTEEKGVGRKLAAYSVHSLRHSLSTWLNAVGVPEMMRMRLVGHEDEEVSRGYTHTEILSLPCPELRTRPDRPIRQGHRLSDR